MPAPLLALAGGMLGKGLFDKHKANEKKQLDTHKFRMASQDLLESKNSSPENIGKIADRYLLDEEQMFNVVKFTSQVLTQYRANQPKPPETPPKPNTEIVSILKPGSDIRIDVLMNMDDGTTIREIGPTKQETGATNSKVIDAGGERKLITPDGKVLQNFGTTTQQQKLNISKEEKLKKKQFLSESIVASADNIDKVINEALDILGVNISKDETGKDVYTKGHKEFGTTGLTGSIAGMAPMATDASRLENLYETIRSNIAGESIKEMKAMSGSTGYGQLNLKELEVIMNKVRKLDRVRIDDATQIKDLKAIKEFFKDKSKLARQEGGGRVENPDAPQLKPVKPKVSAQGRAGDVYSQDEKVNRLLMRHLGGN